MNMKKKAASLLALTLVLTASIGAYASTGSAYGEVFNMTEEQAYALAREEGKTLMQLAEENGNLEGFKTAVIADKAAQLQESVAEGELTQERADLRIAHMTEQINAADPDERTFGEGGQKNGYENRQSDRTAAKNGTGIQGNSENRPADRGQRLGNSGVCVLEN